MKSKSLFFIALLLCCTTVACKKENSDEPDASNEQQDYFPYIQVGNRWVYDFIYNGQVVDSLSREIISRDSQDIYGSELQDSKMTVHEKFIKKGKDLLYQMGNQQSPQRVLLAKAEPTMGETWVKWDGTDSFLVEVKQTNKLVTTALGNFTCYTLKETNLGTGFSTYYDINATVGLVRIDMEYQGKPVVYLLRGKNFSKP